MLQDLTRHLSHYLSLIGILVVSVFGLVYFQYDKSFQTAICLAAGISYVTWGIVHHHIHEDLNTRIVFEYLSSSLLGIVVLLYVIWS